jgi:hypothetical protein
MADIAQGAMVALGRDVDDALEAALRRLPGVDVVSGAPQTTVIVSGASTPVTTRVIGLEDVDAVLDDDRSALVLIRGVIDDATAVRLEDAGVGHVDAAGRAWLPGQPRTATVRSARSGATRALRAPVVRLAQLLADNPDRPWSERGLAAMGRSTAVTAHHFLAKLEEDGLVQRKGAGRATERRVGDSRAFWEWLAKAGRPARPMRLSCFVREPEKIPSEVDGRKLYLTGALAAERLGVPVLSGVQRTTYRVEVDADGLEDVPQALGGFRTDRGANVVLIADPDGLAQGSSEASTEEQLIATPSRVMLDLYLEPRGAAAAELFAQLWPARITDD